ncbi:MAG: type II toxin-antitoxin system HigB family toxin [Xenococcaceae cyanobacterium MO_167.B27]|nr:type II toxin-antitoxin system HigB family toxin [Xenococcaceae cyanobacterium MO_167.B27]
MHLISAGKLKQEASKYPHLTKTIQAFCKTIKQAKWQNLIDVQKTYRDAEAVGNFTIFNIKGNQYRLILDIDYQEQVAYFKYFLTHSEYDREQWKNDPYFK